MLVGGVLRCFGIHHAALGSRFTARGRGHAARIRLR